jgi:GTP-binding protein
VFAISALDGTGCSALTYAVMDYLGTQVRPAEDEPAAGLPATESPAAD